MQAGAVEEIGITELLCERKRLVRVNRPLNQAGGVEHCVLRQDKDSYDRGGVPDPRCHHLGVGRERLAAIGGAGIRELAAQGGEEESPLLAVLSGDCVKRGFERCDPLVVDRPDAADEAAVVAQCGLHQQVGRAELLGLMCGLEKGLAEDGHPSLALRLAQPEA